MREVLQSSAARNLPFLLVLSTDHLTGATGRSPTVTVSKNGGAFASPAGAIVEVGNGFYYVTANATDSNTLGSLIVHATAAGCDPSDTEFEVVAFNPRSATNLGLSEVGTTNTRVLLAIPAAAAGTPNGIPRLGTNTISGTDFSISGGAGTALLIDRFSSLMTFGAVRYSNNLAFYNGVDADVSFNGNDIDSIKSGATRTISALPASGTVLSGGTGANQLNVDSGNMAGSVGSILTAGITTIVAAVWDRLLSLHTTAGTTGKKLSDLTSGGGGGGGPINITPIESVVSVATAESYDGLGRSPVRLSISQYGTTTLKIACYTRVDGVKTAVDLSAATLRFTLFGFDAAGATVGLFQVNAASITVDGTDNQQANIPITQAMTTTARKMLGILWDISGGETLAVDRSYAVEIQVTPAVLAVP